jgi:predicted amidohydrolase
MERHQRPQRPEDSHEIQELDLAALRRGGKCASLLTMSMAVWLVLPAARAATATSVQLQTNETTVAWGKPGEVAFFRKRKQPRTV